MAAGWNEVLPHVVNTIASASIGYGGRWLYEQWKRIRFATSDWKLWYVYQDSAGGVGYSPTPTVTRIIHIQYHFTVRIFNEKSSAIGLHRFSVLFTKGKGRAREILIRDENVRHGEEEIRAGQRYTPPLGEMMLEPKSWAVEDIMGYPREAVATFQKADAVWLVAHTASGKKYEWHVTDLTPAA